MKKNMMRRNLHRSIKSSITRYIAIVAIIALGSAIFVGLRTTKSDMIATGQQYMDSQNMFDLRLLNTYGWNPDQVEQVAQLPGVVAAEGVVSLDAIVHWDQTGTESVYKLAAIPQDINLVYLHGGRMPQAPNECLADAYQATDDVLGKTFTLAKSNTEETRDSLTAQSYTVVGYASTPLYMDMSRGNTTLGNGTLAGFVYLPQESFCLDYFTEIVVTLPGEKTIYTDSYHDRMEQEGERLKALVTPLAQSRYQSVLGDAQDAYNEGLAEYKEGLADYKSGKEEAFAKLDDAKAELQQAERELAENRDKLDKAKEAFAENEKLLSDGKQKLMDSRTQLAEAKAEAYKTIADASAELIKNKSALDAALLELNNGLSQLDSGISQLESGLSQLETMISLTQVLLDAAKPALQAAQSAYDFAVQHGFSSSDLAELEAALTEAEAKVSGYENDLAEMKLQYETLSAQLLDLQQKRQQALDAKAPLDEAKLQLDNGLKELEISKAKADAEFMDAEAELIKAEADLEKGLLSLAQGKTELEDGIRQLEEGQKKLDDGWKEYNKGFVEASSELADAWTQLEDGRLELADAKNTIDKMEEPSVYALGRTANMGYIALDNNSDIVEGVSAVFPAFFLLIAALVCITTMTRMVDDERTQIGTMKALGYSSFAIMSKYLAYSGSAAILGCGLGVVVGSIVFPLILWDAYQIIMQLGDEFVLRIDWPLCLIVVVVYTAVTLLVTWYCCHKSLKEVPAELIRPKAPTTGKSIFLEKLPFWSKFSFLNKVMLRNIFRYRQRLVMMLIGVGGCTALLLTGFGIRDSIGNLADYQFDEVILYDHEVRFVDNMDDGEQADFMDAFSGRVDKAYFYHQSSMELTLDGKVVDVNFIAGEKELGEYIDFHNGKDDLPMPGVGKALISVGMANRLHIGRGDMIIVRNEDMRELSLEVSGIFDNNVNNYVVVNPRTVASQWGYYPDKQMACIYAAEGEDVYALGADIISHTGVMNVTVNEDVRTSVGQMLNALDMVVVTIVICATLLAVVVTYNLTNINITERLREIATIKVLGFRESETAAYVFKENLFLSVIGSILGLGGGILLLEFVISKVQVDFVWITARLVPVSYLLAVIITMISAVIVDFILYFKLKKINMAEALKSVE